MLGNEVHAYFDLLYPAAPGDAFHVMSWRSHPDAPLKNQWVRCADATNLIDHIVQSTPELEIWLGVGLRHPGCTPASDRRGKNEDIYAIPGLWIDLDHSGGVHVAQHLPTPQELLAFIHELPFTFSLLIDTGGGYHGYCLFKEMWLLATPAERHVAALLLRCFQRTIQTRAAERGWKVDCTADLARILRPAGTYNHKTKPCKPVTILQEDAIRYNPSDIADAPWLATIEETYTPSTDTGDFPQPPLDPIVNGCRWLQHCRDDAAALPEPEWYAMLGIVGRCVEGEQIAHAWSAPYPRYTAAETAQKLRHALQYGPRTCSTIRFDLGGEEHCRTCQHWQKIKSPIVLGLPRMQDSQQHRHRQPAEQVEAVGSQETAPPEEAQAAPESPPEPPLAADPWPTMAPEAFYGLAGEIVRVIDPYTEADPVAVLLNTLVAVGNVIGDRLYAMVQHDRHPARLNVVQVGDSSKGRKGTGWSTPRYLLAQVDAAWAAHRIKSGLSSGEGLIYNVRDALWKHEPIKEKGRVIAYQEVETDPGEPDKRLLIVEPEFASALTVMAREGNILSGVIRQAF